MTLDFKQITDAIIGTVTEFATLSIPITLPNDLEINLNLWIPIITFALLGIIVVSFKNK